MFTIGITPKQINMITFRTLLTSDIFFNRCIGIIRIRNATRK